MCDIDPVVSQRMKVYEQEMKEHEDETYRMDESDHINKSSEIIHQSRGRRPDDDSGLLIHDSQQDIDQLHELKTFTLERKRNSADSLEETNKNM